jgi:predicted phage gp36 major capsid-like protein
VLYGNFNYYGIIEKPGLLIQRNPYLYMANGQIGLFATMFRGGAVLQAEAFYHTVGK